MEKIYCVICNRYKKLKKPKMSYIFEMICSNFENEDEKIFKEEESIQILKILVLFKNM